MASITMTASFLGGAALAKGSPAATAPRRLVVARAAAGACEGKEVKVSVESAKEEGRNGRRSLVCLAGAAAAAAIACGMAFAEEPKPGTPEAKKIYSAVCVTNPTARICRK